uniref:Uncharacterized protein n=1 Tax=Aegilops tauschii TaxID=37682 RepID=M8CZV5_AEGTA
MPDMQPLISDFVLKLKRRKVEGSHAVARQTAELLRYQGHALAKELVEKASGWHGQTDGDQGKKLDSLSGDPQDTIQ